MHQYSFEKLDTWQLARKFVVKIYHYTNEFQSSERYGLVSQMRRSAVSVCSNLAEGCSRVTNKDKRKFYNIAYGSLMELINQLIICNDLGWINNDIMFELRSEFEVISYKIISLIKSTPDND